MIYIVVALLGLCLGSFVNALVWRLHEQSKSKRKKAKPELSILKGRSMCPNCRHLLHAKDLVPVFSWLSLRGKCRYCSSPISKQYPFVELLTATLFLISYVFWPDGLGTLGLSLFVAWLMILVGFIALAVYDLKWMLLPNKLVYGLLGLVVLQVIGTAIYQRSFSPVVASFWGFLVLGGLFYLLFQISGGKWIGGGDVKLGFVLGVLLGGPGAALLVLFLSSFGGTLVSLPMLITGKAKRTTRIPYGPFLLAAGFVAKLFGAALLNWYQTKFLFL